MKKGTKYEVIVLSMKKNSNQWALVGKQLKLPIIWWLCKDATAHTS